MSKNKEFSISSWAVENRVTVYILTAMIVITGLANLIYIWFRTRSERWLK